MQCLPSKLCLRWMISLLAYCSFLQAADFYVSPDGNDANPGTRDAPFQSLQAAQKAARQIARREAVNISLRGGFYYLSEPLVLSEQDSGSMQAPVIWKAADGETPVLSGGEVLRLEWHPYKDGIYETKVPAGLETDQLFINGERQILARYPNFNPKERIFNGHAADAISPERVKSWADPIGGLFHAMHPGLWGGFSYQITGKGEDGSLQYEGGWQGNRPAKPHANCRMVEGIFEELDAPGEWFLDRKTYNLYFLPPAGVELKTAKVEIARLKNLVELRGTEQHPVRHITLQGMTLRHAARTFMLTKEPILRSDWTIYRGGAVLFNGTENCTLEDSFIDQVGGNAVFVNNYNRRVTIRRCRIEKAGAGGVTFVGDPAAVRSPLFQYGQTQNYDTMDKTPGPQNNNYPADCLVDDCLITHTGRFEKQSAGIGIDMAARITIRHCSIYEMPRAGINIGDGCWGGHIVEFCDVFDTVKETGDHGAFNSWGRDRFWNLDDIDVREHPELPYLDVVEPITLRNSRWRCDHGWDIDLDDGSSNYLIYNNLCLNGGIKNREGYGRVVENNIMINNGFHPHLWYPESGDIFRRNIVSTGYAPARMKHWDGEFDYNLVHKAGLAGIQPAIALQAKSGKDKHSIVVDALFIAPAQGDYRVKEGSPALALGFQNFPMDQFGVQTPALRALARSPDLTTKVSMDNRKERSKRSDQIVKWLGASFKNVIGIGEMSANGLFDETGVRLVEMSVESAATSLGFQENDVILKCNDIPTMEMASFIKAVNEASAHGQAEFEIWRNQKSMKLDVPLEPANLLK